MQRNPYPCRRTSRRRGNLSWAVIRFASQTVFLLQRSYLQCSACSANVQHKMQWCTSETPLIVRYILQIHIFYHCTKSSPILCTRITSKQQHYSNGPPVQGNGRYDYIISSNYAKSYTIYLRWYSYIIDSGHRVFKNKISIADHFIFNNIYNYNIIINTNAMDSA